MSYDEMADAIERFAGGSSASWEWEEYFLTAKCDDPLLKYVQQRVLAVSFEFSPGAEGGYTNSEGLAVLRGLAYQLRSEARKSRCASS
jgi:hypothetical protein